LDFQKEQVYWQRSVDLQRLGGGDEISFTKNGGFFGACLVCWNFGVCLLSWCLWARFAVGARGLVPSSLGSLGYMGVFARRTFLDVVLRCWCDFTYWIIVVLTHSLPKSTIVNLIIHA
jgi:hypothetical protein